MKKMQSTKQKEEVINDDGRLHTFGDSFNEEVSYLLQHEQDSNTCIERIRNSDFNDNYDRINENDVRLCS